MSPLCESFVPADQLDAMEPFYPLHVRVCAQCLLVQINDYVTAESIFTEYAYYSSYSTSWLDHARSYVASMSDGLGLGADSFVVELASNDGYLLQYFVERGIPCLGIEPSVNVSAAARAVVDGAQLASARAQHRRRRARRCGRSTVPVAAR